MPLSQLRAFLDQNNIKYLVISHSVAYTAQGIAALAHIPGQELATETEFRDRFPDCETGAMPPFGNLYGMDVFADETLTLDKEIAFNAGSHRELLRMSFADFRDLVKPALISLVSGKVGAHAA